MPDNKQVKSLVTTCQDTLAKYLDLLVDVGSVPYSLLKASILHATPQQLYRIEKANPDIAAESDELWLKHCLLFQDIRHEYEQGLHQDPKQWRELYLNKYQENEKKRQLIKEKVKNQYSKIQNEKEKKSIKVLHGVVPTKKRHSYESARRSTMSKLFQQTKKETDKVASIYHSSPKRPKPIHQHTTTIRVPKPASQLTREYQDNFAMHSRASFSPPAPSPLIQPKSKSLSHEPSPKRLKSNNTINEKKKPVAMVNFNIFNELS
ncbi:RNA polymerase II transcription factor SIII subunit A-domain-containing protein [Gilbertella persicaria]|uniref:RNA polymerase II transcription factor SIII subunit A-domain-containing protein n=1 Tax=Gilbertella persicaria TaxID=101096 RepID=UPI00221EB528|nr:RNA polymerase II transcription factor SIII subunit A-domain-containing protein [Gilbertella persicaria]KAI8062792.1 RNA polymerase II transcription factor SIII subunit A-domain-containing protein [Gilbertella persicaria]